MSLQNEGGAMPPKLDADLTFEALEDQVLFTIAAIEGDQDAADLLGMTAKWLAQISAESPEPPTQPA
jgi:hypothetical protein